MTEIISLRMNTKDKEFKVIKKAYSNITLENCKTLTSYVDHLLFKSRTLKEVLEKVQEAKEVKFTESKDFKNLSILKKHVKYRIAHDRFTVSETKALKRRYVSLNI